MIKAHLINSHLTHYTGVYISCLRIVKPKIKSWTI